MKFQHQFGRAGRLDLPLADERRRAAEWLRARAARKYALADEYEKRNCHGTALACSTRGAELESAADAYEGESSRDT